MAEQEAMARLWESFPPLAVAGIYNYGVKSVLVDDKALLDHMRCVALYFFRGGVAHLQGQEENNG